MVKLFGWLPTAMCETKFKRLSFKSNPEYSLMEIADATAPVSVTFPAVLAGGFFKYQTSNPKFTLLENPIFASWVNGNPANSTPEIVVPGELADAKKNKTVFEFEWVV